MKKFALRLAAALLAAGMILSMTACTSSGPESSVASETSTVSEASTVYEMDEEPSTENNTSDETGKYASISDFVNSDLLQSQMESLKSTASEAGMDIEITGEGNKLIYTFVISDELNVDGIAETLEAGLESQASTFESVASSIALAVEVENPVVVVRYVDTQGNEIAAREFTAG